MKPYNEKLRENKLETSDLIAGSNVSLSTNDRKVTINAEKTEVIDSLTSDSSTAALSAAKGKALADNFQYYQKLTLKGVNLSSLNQNTYYPVVGSSMPKSGMHRLKLAVELNSGTKPSWSTHNSGFSCNLDLLNEPGGWGTTAGKGIILESTFRFTDTMPVSYQQLGNSSRPVFWCRGGGIYYIYTDYDATWTVYTSSVTFSEQTVAPTTTCPSTSLSSYCDIVIGTIASGGNITADGYIQAIGSLSTKDSIIQATNHGNTVSIGSQNSSYCHIYNSADIPFYFNKNILVNGNTLSSITYRDVSFSKKIDSKSYEYESVTVPEIAGFTCIACSVYYGSGASNGYIQVRPTISGSVALYNPTGLSVTDTFHIRYVYLKN